MLTGQNDRANALRGDRAWRLRFLHQAIRGRNPVRWTIERAFRVHDLQEENKRLQSSQQAPRDVGDHHRAIRRCSGSAAPSRRWRRPRPPCCCSANRAPARSCSHARCTTCRPRQAERFVAINCAAIPGERCSKANSSATRRAPTRARSSRRSARSRRRIEGTLFLDEIGDLPVSLQAKLLRFLQERVIERVGGRREVPVDVRIVCATHQEPQGADRRPDVSRGPLLSTRRDRGRTSRRCAHATATRRCLRMVSCDNSPKSSGDLR